MARWHAVTPDPHITLQLASRSSQALPPAVPLLSPRQPGPILANEIGKRRVDEPGMCPATGSMGSIHPETAADPVRPAVYGPDSRHVRSQLVSREHQSSLGMPLKLLALAVDSVDSAADPALPIERIHHRAGVPTHVPANAVSTRPSPPVLRCRRRKQPRVWIPDAELPKSRSDLLDVG